MRRIALALVVFLMVLSSGAVPQLKHQPEVLAAGELKGRVLAGSRGKPPVTPAGQLCRITRGAETQEYKVFNPEDLWRLRATVGTWEDAKGNVLRIARVLSLVPTLDQVDCSQEKIDAQLDALGKAFEPTEENLASWKRCWGVKGSGEFSRPKGGGLYWVEFDFAEKMAPAAEKKLIRAAVGSLSRTVVAAPSQSMKWWEKSNAQYTFLTDLDPNKGKRFISDSMKLMSALRKGFEFYVPPKGPVAVGKVRIFSRRADYQAYRQETGSVDLTTSGLWDPNRDELLVVAEEPEGAHATMRHEAFHQYLHYATGRGDHASWFNEGHATLFESVKYNPAKNTIRITDEGNRAGWVTRDPVRFAKAIPRVLRLSHEEFGTGNVNDHYVAAWAVCYFLEKGAFTSEVFAPYRGICAKYLELMGQGVSPEEATDQAWAVVKDRDVVADFLKFWREKRKAAVGKRL